MTAKPRRLALLVACAFLFVILSCTVLISINLLHDCIGENCPICLQIAAIERGEIL